MAELNSRTEYLQSVNVNQEHKLNRIKRDEILGLQTIIANQGPDHVFITILRKVNIMKFLGQFSQQTFGQPKSFFFGYSLYSIV